MDKVVISHVGLADKDLVLIRNLLRLNTTWFGHFELAQRAGTHEGQILLIDQDKMIARQAWRNLRTYYPKECVISIGQVDGEQALGAQHLSRPLVFRRLADALKTATRLSGEMAAAPASASQPSILVVDDSIPVRTFMKQKLFELFSGDVAIALADSGEQGVMMAAENQYDLVFMDVVMPGIDGYKACRQIKSNRKTPVVMLTSKSSTLNRVKAHMSGCDGYLTKPPEDQQLRHIVYQHIGSADKSALNGRLASAS